MENNFFANYIQRYSIRDREAGNLIDRDLSLDEAIMRIADYEDSDRQEGIYAPDFYEITKQD